jgi:hypothetical protein
MVDRQAHATLELSLSLRNLPQIDYLSKSDPFIAVRYNNNYMARTETIWNNHDPDFLKLIQVQYLFEQTQDIEFHVFDADSNSKDLAKQNFIGSVKTTVADLAAALQGKSKFNIRASDGRIVQGSEGPTLLIVRAEQLKEENHDITLSIKVHDLPSSFALSPSTFLEISRTMDDNSLVCVYRSQVILALSYVLLIWFFRPCCVRVRQTLGKSKLAVKNYAIQILRGPLDYLFGQIQCYLLPLL